MALSKTFIRGTRTPGKHLDRRHLYLDIPKDRPGGGHWVYRFTLNGAAGTIGLGPRTRDPDAVRADANRFDAFLERGIDPRAGMAQEARQAAAEAARRVTFRQVAETFLEARSPGWSSAKHVQQWRGTLAAYAYPAIGDLAVSELATPDIFELLRPLWATKPETASRVRGRIEAILDFAKAQGHRSGENPAGWRGNLALMLPARRLVRPVRHHAALEWREAPVFLVQLREQNGMGARALEFTILTAARSGEARLATWDEIDLEAAVWTIPAERMKARRQHRVPLSRAAVLVLERVAISRTVGTLVFPDRAPGVPLSDKMLTAPLRRMGRGDLTAHGFRSSFRDWAAEATHYPNHVVEQALAHTIGNAVEAAYRRGDLFDKRRALMDDWAGYLAAGPALAAAAE